MLCALLGFIYNPVISQSIIDIDRYFDSYLIRNLGVEDGMPDEESYYVHEDKNGFIWIANINGLVRYDGLTLKEFRKGYNSGSLYEIYSAGAGSFWIPSIGEGLYKFQGDSLFQFKEEIPSPSGLVKSMVVLKDSTLALGLYGAGLTFFDGEKATKTLTTEDGLVSDEIWKIIIDRKERLWIGTNDGVSIYEDGSFINFTTENGLPFNNIRGLTEMSNGDVWVGTDKEGIVIFRNDKPFKYLTKEDGLSDSDPQYFAENPIDHSIWIAHHGGGLDVYRDGKIENLNTSDGLVSNFLTFVGFSKDGTGYIASETGVSVLTKKIATSFDENTPGITTSAISTVGQDKDGTIWLGSDGSGFFNFRNGSWSVIESPDNDDNFTNGYSSSSAIDNDGNIWFGTPGTGVVKVVDRKVVQKISDGEGLLDNFSRGLAFDNENNLWIGTNKGINVLDQNLEHVAQFTVENGLPNDFCITMHSDSKGRVWYGSYGGGAVLFENKSISAVFDTSNGLNFLNIFSIFEHSNGKIYFGAGASGISVYDGTDMTYYGTDVGFPPRSVSGIAEDKYGMLWLATGNGIYVIDPNELEEAKQGIINEISFTAYSTEDGLPSQKMEPANNATTTSLKDGNILFASVKGGVLINPDNARINVDSFSPYLNDFVVDEIPLPMRSLRALTPKDKKLEISYSALNIRAPKKTKFRIKLSGVDEDWNYVGDRTSAYYDFLPDGKYIFTVSAIGPDGQWSDKTAAVSFTILPPYYKTWWFISLCLLGFVALGAGGVQIRSNLKLQKLNQELQTQQKIQQERVRISRELHDNVGSQITNLITGIEISNLHVKKNQQDQALSLLENLDSDARGAMTDLRETIWLLDKEEVEFGIFLDHLRGYVKRQEMYLKEMKVSIHSNVDKHKVLNPTQSLNLTRIIQEVLNNARKYAHATSFSISFLEQGSSLETQLIDNGIGMDLDTSITKGNGLKNIKERIDELNGTLSLTSEIDKGTSFFINF